MKNVIECTDYRVIGEELASMVNESKASAEDKAKFKEEFKKAHAFFNSCVDELKVRAKNGKDYVQELAVAFWNKMKDLATKLFGYCKELFEKVKAFVLGVFNK